MSMSLAAATALSGLAAAGASAASTGINYTMTGKINKKQEALMRESWAREDNAVQRRVADLKAAGLSPTLAAGSAASSSGPIKLNTPQVDFGGIVNHSLEAMSAVQALRGQKLDNENKRKTNELLQKQIDAFGLPDWYNAMINIFGLDGVRDFLKGIGNKFTGGASAPQIINNVYDSLMSGFDPGFKFAFTPKGEYTASVTPASPEVVESVKDVGGTVTQDSDGSTAVVFESKAQAKQWFLDIGGTTAEWYQGIRDYGSPEKFLDWILGTGGWYFK